MAIGNYYPVNLTISDNDLFLGTNGNSNNTVNYTAQAVADYLNTNAKVSIGGQLSFRFDTVPGIAKTISFNGGGGDNTPFSSITQLIVSSTDASGADITIFLNYLVNGEILLAQQNQPNNFGNYKITAYTPFAAPYFYALQLQYIGGNGNIMEDKYYDLSPFVLSGSGNIPTLNQVLTAGNVSLLNAKIGVLYGYDTNNLDYGTLEFYDSGVVIKGAATNQLLFYNDGLGAVRFSNGAYTPMLNFSGVGNNVYTFQNANGTVAFLSDIPSIFPNALTRVNDTNVTLTLGGTPNTALLQGVSLTLGWTGTLADGRIASASTWNAKQNAITLTTTGSSGPATFVSNTLNIPDYSSVISGYVPTSRTLTINGTTYDLTANRSWSVGTVTSVGLSMPSAFTVSSSPITTSGTIAVTGAGVASQYVRGDGTLANFPTSTGGGASVSYYLNGSVSQGTIGGVAYKEMNSVPVIGAGTDFSINADGYIAQFITDVGDPNKLLIPGGNWNFETYFSASSGGGTPRFYIELYKYDGAAFTLIASNSTSPEFITGSTSIDLYFSALAVPPTTLTVTDRLAVRFYVIHSGRTITMHTENSHLSQIITTFSSGLTALNGLTSQVQYLAVGTSGTDFNISSATDTHTFNLPTASATNRGALSSIDWSAFNSKFTLPSLTSGSVLFSNGTTIAQDNANFFWDDTNNRLGIGIATPYASLTIQDSTSNQIVLKGTSGIDGISSFSGGILVSFDATLGPYFQYQYSALTMIPALGFITYAGFEVLTGNITTGYIPKKSPIGVTDSNIYDDGTNVGILTITPATALDVNGVITATGGNSTSWNAKQNALVSGTNIKTINGNSVLGSGDLTISGGSGLLGVHSIVPIPSGGITNQSINGLSSTNSSTAVNRLILMPYIPAQSFTTSNFIINVPAAIAGSLARILIYSDVNGLPNTKLYESANLDCSTIGNKTATTSFSFTAGTTYWLAVHTSAAQSLSHLQVGGILSIRAGITIPLTCYALTIAFGSAPSVVSVTTASSFLIPQIFITKA